MITIDGDTLSICDVIAVSRRYEQVAVAHKQLEKIHTSRRTVETILRKNQIVYGITTGFGELANTLISPRQAQQLQVNLIRSHAVGVGEPFAEDIVRAIILLRANALVKGYSGVRLELITYLLELLNRRITPFIPSQGSVGSSGDLAPLAHLALTVMGEGECLQNGQRVPSADVLKKAGLSPLSPMAKEGLAMINGTQVMTAIGTLAVHDAEWLLKNAQVAGSMSLEALRGTARAFDKKVHDIRPHPGQQTVAANIRRLVNGSRIIESHADCNKVQDAYTLRCIPQVYGAILDTIAFSSRIIGTEINSATDNPLIFSTEQEVISGGNFHGEPLAFAMDFLGIALAEIANISERTIDRLVNPHVSGLPPFLSPLSGLHSGFMIAQYTAAALVSENKVLAHPSSVDSIPTSAGQEDHVSMGTIAARHTQRIIQNVEHVLAIEMLCAAQGIDFLNDQPGSGTGAAHRYIRRHIDRLYEDRILYHDIEKVRQMVISGEIVRHVETEIGLLE